MTDLNQLDGVPAAPAAPASASSEAAATPETPAVSSVSAAPSASASAAAPAPAPRRWRRAAAWTGGGLVALALTATGALWWWTGTEGSLATALGWVEKSQPLSAQNVSGSLRAGGHIGQLQWKKDGLKVLARDVSLAWQPRALLDGRLQIDRLSAASVQADDQRPPKPSTPPGAIALPLRVTLAAFSLGQLDVQGASKFSASSIAGRYDFDGLRHQLALSSAQVASGHYSGRASLSASAPLKLEAALSGALSVNLPKHPAAVPLRFEATASGLLTELTVKAELKVSAAPAPGTEKTVQPHASATAQVTPWAAQPLAQADADFHDLDLAALWPDAPQTLLTGSAKVQPLASTAAKASAAWLLDLKLANALPGPWDQHRLPLARLDTQGEWRNGTAMVRSLKASLGGGELLASGDWRGPATGEKSASASASASATGPAAAAPAPGWSLSATLKRVNTAQLDTRLGPLLLDGRAELSGQGAATQFDASLQAAGSAGKPPAASSASASATATATATATSSSSASTFTSASASGPNRLLAQLGLRDASATGSWNPQLAGGTLALSALKIHTSEAELSGQLELQPAAKSGQGQLAFSAPGLDAKVSGQLRETSGGGELSLHGRDAAQTLRWLQTLPGLPAALRGASASGGAELQASWQGGWQDPALQARLDLPSLDWRPAAKATAQARTQTQMQTPTPASADAATSTSTSTATATPPKPAPASTSLVKIRALQATLSGRLSQAQLAAQGRIELDQRRLSLQLAASGGRLKSAAAPATSGSAAWKGLLEQLSLSVEDPALGPGPWRLATSGGVPFQWTPTNAGGAFESGAGQALLSAPLGKTQAATRPQAFPSQTTPTQQAQAPATLAWQPLRWRAGEFITAGKLTGLPMAWIELVAGPQLAGAGLGGNMIFDGQWDAVLGNTLKLKASLTRSSGDITVQAEGAQGNSMRVAAGAKQASVSLESVGDALSLALRWDSERAGSADGQLKTRLARIPGADGQKSWGWPLDAPLNGQLRAQLPRIGVWSLLAPPGWRLRGSLGADVAVSGTRAAPSLAGSLQADDMALRSVVDGIEFGHGRLRASLDGTRIRISEFTLQGAGDKGAGGTLSAQGEAGWIDGKAQVQLDARLQRLRASLRTDRQITVSGDVQANLKDGQSELTGKLLIDQARILLPDEGTPRLGDDVIVRSASGAATGEKAPAQTSGAAPDKATRPIKLTVQIDLGRDFQIQGKGMDTLVRGTLALSSTAQNQPQLNGTVRTSGGQYRTYGQRLEIERGVVRFTGPLDNPTLNILAIRPNLTQRVGVQITGTALLPSVRLYAEPELADAEKLSWLIVGRASASGGAEAALLQQAALALLGSKAGSTSGGLAASLGLDELSFRGASSNADGSASSGAVTLGKRFSRNFYAAYERSISGAMGTLYVFYDLSRRFTLRAQAGQQSAVDLIFTIPYD